MPLPDSGSLLTRVKAMARQATGSWTGRGQATLFLTLRGKDETLVFSVDAWPYTFILRLVTADLTCADHGYHSVLMATLGRKQSTT